MGQQPPRQIEVDRKKRVFAGADVKSLVTSELNRVYDSNGYQQVQNDSTKVSLAVLNDLDINLFDNTEFEIYEPEV